MADSKSNSPTDSSSDKTAAKKSGSHFRQTLYMVIAIVSAIILAVALPHVAVSVELGGQIFLRLLQMVVVPLVMASVMSGILGLGDVRKLGKPGGVAVCYYLATTLMAVFTGLMVVNVIQPGKGVDKRLVEDARREGAREVSEKSRSEYVTATWVRGTDPNTRVRSTSDVMRTSEMKVIKVRIAQIDNAVAAARVRVEVREAEGGEWTTLKDGEFQAEPTDGDYVHEFSLPADAEQTRLVFEPQQGGAASILSAELSRGPPTITDIMHNLLLMLFTDNLLEAMVRINLLPLIVFSIVFAGMLTTLHQGQAVKDFIYAINDALMSFILLLMKIAPLGIFCLIASRFGKAVLAGQFDSMIKTQFSYMLTVLLGLGIHFIVTLPLILWLFTRRNPIRFVMQMSQAVLTAFSTASSTATLPVTMECAESNAGVSRRSTEFVLPLGATINMDGTALYEAAAAIFIAQAFAVEGFELTLVQQLTIAMTATLAAIGAAGIPEAGLVTMLIVLNAVGLPIEAIGLILPFDWLLDRFRTAVNAYGDSVGAAVVDPSFGNT